MVLDSAGAIDSIAQALQHTATLLLLTGAVGGCQRHPLSHLGLAATLITQTQSYATAATDGAQLHIQSQLALLVAPRQRVQPLFICIAI